MMLLILRNFSLFATVVFLTTQISLASNNIYYDSDGYGSTEKEAIEDALRKVAWNCLADFSQMSPDSVKRFVKNIDVSSIIKSYSTIKSSDSTEHDTTTVSIHAEMNMSAVIKVLENRHEKSPLTCYPRVLLTIKKNGTEHFNSTDAFTRTIEEKLVSKKMVLHNKKVIDSLFPESQTTSTGEYSSVYYKAGADFVITGTIEIGEPYTADVYGAKQKRISCCANLQLIDCSDARVLSSISLCEDWGSQSIAIARENCLKALVKNKKFSLIDSIETIWKKYQYTVFPVSIHFYDLTDSTIDEIESRLKKLPSVVQIKSKILNVKESRLDIFYRGSMLDVYNDILDMKDISISISGKGNIHISNRNNTKISDSKVDTFATIDTNSNMNQISVTGYTIPPLYPCAIEHYSMQPYGTITLSNNSTKKLERIHLSSSISGLSIPHDTIIDHIAPQEAAIIPITTALDQREIQKIDHSTKTKISVRCSIKEKNNTRSTDFHLPVTINGLNDFDWKKPEMIGSFITPSDQAVNGLSRFALSAITLPFDSIPQNVTQTAAIYECLRKTGIAYIKDVTIKKDIDNIQFPYQTLLMGTGDCDDTSVLLASLLESIGIETSILVSENHVLIMFNTGVHSKNSYVISRDTTNYIAYKDMIWLPIETTNFNERSFLEALKKGLEQYRDSKYYSFISVINTHQSWEKYPPANPVHQEIPIPKINIDNLSNAINKVLNQFVTDRNEEFEKVEKKYLSMSHKNPDKTQYNQLGIFYAQNNIYEKSLINFKKAFELAPRDPDVIVNLANIYCLQGQYDSAEQLYSDAVKLNPDDGSYYLNQYLFYLKFNHPEKSTESLRKFIEKAGIEKLNAYLGLELASDINISNKGENVSVGKYSISIQLIKNSIKRVGKSIFAPGKKRKTPTILPVGDRIDMVDLSKLFYFKQLQE